MDRLGLSMADIAPTPWLNQETFKIGLTQYTITDQVACAALAAQLETNASLQELIRELRNK